MRKAVLWAVTAFALILSYFIIGNFSIYAIAILIMTAASLILSSAKSEEAKRTFISLSLASFIALIVIVILPYIFLSDFYSPYFMVLIYVFPVLIVFFAAFMTIHHYVSKLQTTPIHILKASFLPAAAVCILTSFSMLILINHFYQTNNDQMDTAFNDVQSKINSMITESDLKVAKDLMAYKSRIKKPVLDDNCFTDCFRTLNTRALLVEQIIDIHAMNRTLFFIEQNKTGDEIDLELPDKAIIDKLESDFTYDNLAVLSQSLYLNQENMFGDSVLLRSIEHAFKHTTSYREGIRLVAKVQLASRYPPFYIYLYQNAGNESGESKAVRNAILQDYASSYKN